jgi:S-adenosylmethionine:tRNA ribosyltransferase-isomerase
MDNSHIDTNALKISDFDYHLPQELIAQTPIEPRDASRLLVVHRASGTLEHRHFYEICAYLRPGDLLIANQSRVLPARLLGHRAETGGAVEVLLLAERADLGPDHWETLVRPGRRLREGARVVFGDDASLHAEILQCTEAGGRILRFFVDLPGISTTPRVTRSPDRASCLGGRYPARGTPTGSTHRLAIHDRDIVPSQISTDDRSMVGAGDPVWGTGNAPALAPIHDEVIAPTVRRLIERLGRMPLPPYIHEPLADPERYQTVYARISGSAAAPTAGLHFTPQLLERLRRQGVRVGFVTLHVGLDTFKPVESEDVSEHKMHSEAIDLDAPTAELINETRSAGGRVIAVGTTSVRVLESVANVAGFKEGSQLRIGPYCGHTRLFITPGYHFRIVDAMITNFHLPRSTLLLLVSAFAGKQLIEKAYQEAIRERYRFFSFGDAMLLMP